jgi:peptide/nickel transport system substrate-binding protein
MKRRHFLMGATAGILCAPAMSWAQARGPAYFTDMEAAGELPQVAERLPKVPAVASMEEIGRHGGEIRMLMASAKDTRILVAYSYARLVCYDRAYAIVPDILERCDVEGDRVFTMRLREGHKWSDGEPFTAEAFRYYWEDVANDPDLSRWGPRP